MKPHGRPFHFSAAAAYYMYAGVAAVCAAACCASSCSAFQPSPPALTAGSGSNRLLNIKRSTTSSFAPTAASDRVSYAVGPSSPSSSSSSALTLSLLPNAAALSVVGSPLGSVSVLAFVVLIHELGHFLAARSMGIRVEEFSVGVGPRLAGFSRTDDATGDVIDFSFRAIPLGGYVRFPENYNTTLAMIQGDEARQARKELRQLRKEERQREADRLSLADADSDEPRSAGLLSTLTPGWVGRKQREEQRRKKEQEQIEAQEQERLGKERRSWKNLFGLVSNKNDKDSTTSSSPAASELTMSATTPPDIEYYDDPNLLQNRPWTERAVVLSGGVIFNILLAFACYFGELTVGAGLPKPVFREGAVVTVEPRYDGASNGILNKGDVIIGINGKPLMVTRSPSAPETQQAISDFIATIRQTSPGESIRLSVIQAAAAGASSPPSSGSDSSSNSNVPVDVAVQRSSAAPAVTKEITIQPKRNMDDFGNLGPQSIGVMLAPNYVKTDMIRAESVGDAFLKAVGATAEVTTQTSRGLLTLIGNMISGKGAPAGQAVSGPIGLIKSGSDVVAMGSASAVVAFAASISVNLACVNALPLPALDGGQLAFVLAEGATGKKVDQRRQEEINAAALFFLLVLSFSTAIGDVESIVKR